MGTRDDDVDGFVSRHRDQLVRFAYLITQDRGRAEDLTQDAIWKTVRLWKGRLGELENPTAYLRRTVVRDYLGWRKRLASNEFIGAHLVPAESVDAADDDVIRRVTIWRAMSKLPRRQRTVLVLKYYEDLRDDEIAAILGCAYGTVRSLASRGLQTIRKADGKTLIDLMTE